MSRRAPGLGELAALVAQPEARSELFTGALHALREVVECDLAAIWRLEDGLLDVVAAAGPLAGEVVAAHRLRLEDFPTIRHALRQRRPIRLEAHHHDSAEGDPFDGVLDLPEFAKCADWELAGGYTTIDGKRVKDDGLLEKFDVSLEEAQYLVLNARIALGIIDPADLETEEDAEIEIEYDENGEPIATAETLFGDSEEVARG